MLTTFLAAALAGLVTLPVAALSSAADDKPAKARSAERTMDAAATGSTAPVGFDRLDRNRDGYVSRDEAKDAPELQTRFSELDRNNDGKLSREEYDALKAEAAAGGDPR